MTGHSDNNSQRDVIEASGAVLRDVLRDVPSPVVILTAANPEAIFGITIGSMASASLEPPLMTFNVAHGTPIIDALTDGSVCIFHLLSGDDAPLADHFAATVLEGQSQFDRITIRGSVDTVPLLAVSGAALIGRVQRSLGVGDHTLFVAEIDQIVPGSVDGGLAYFRRAYHALDGLALDLSR